MRYREDNLTSFIGSKKKQYYKDSFFFTKEEVQLLDDILTVAARTDELTTEQANFINELQKIIVEKILG